MAQYQISQWRLLVSKQTTVGRGGTVPDFLMVATPLEQTPASKGATVPDFLMAPRLSNKHLRVEVAQFQLHFPEHFDPPY